MKYTAIVIDDEPMPREALKDMILDCPDLDWLGEADDVETALELVMKYSPDAIFLDIKLRGNDAFDLLRKLKNRGEVPAIILNTGHNDLEFGQKAVNLYKDEVVMILKKPFWEKWEEKEAQIVQKIKDYYGKSDIVEVRKSIIKLKLDGTIHLIGTDEIFLIESGSGGINKKGKGKINIYTPEKVFNIWSTLSKFTKQLDSSFVQVSRSSVVNTKYIKSFNSPDQILRLKGYQGYVGVGDTYKSNLLAFLDSL